jgi:hypothetical protein
MLSKKQASQTVTNSSLHQEHPLIEVATSDEEDVLEDQQRINTERESKYVGQKNLGNNGSKSSDVFVIPFNLHVQCCIDCKFW